MPKSYAAPRPLSKPRGVSRIRGMKIELITRVLDGIPGVRRDGAVHLIPDEVEVSVFIGLPSEVLTVPRVARAELHADLLSLETHKGERFHFAVEDVAGLKSSAPEKQSGGRGAGFR
jgi:hypothetical protein